MKLFSFRKKSICENCGNYLPVKTFYPSWGGKIKLCDECAKEIKTILLPINRAQFEEIIENIKVSNYGVWNIPWGVSPEEIIKIVPQTIAAQLKNSKSTTLMEYWARIGNRKVNIHFHFGKSGLNEVLVTPLCICKEVRIALINKFGEPIEEYDRPGPMNNQVEHKLIWSADGCDIEADYIYGGMASISYIYRRE